MTKRQHKKNFYKHIKRVFADIINDLEQENKELRMKLKGDYNGDKHNN